MTQIKVLQNTPVSYAGELLTVTEFREKYTMYNKDNSDFFVIDALSKGEYAIWFQVIEDKFKVGDWVWSEKLNEALQIIADPGLRADRMKPNECTIGAVRDNPQIYLRLAKPLEIDDYTPRMFGDNLLVNRKKVYHFDIVWNEIIGVSYNLNKYFSLTNDLGTVSKIVINETIEWKVKPNGLKIGCTSIEHADLIKIAHLLYMKV